LRRAPWPERVVWKQDDDAPHSRLYWLERDLKGAKTKEIYSARVKGRTIFMESPKSGTATLHPSDALLDLDQPIRIVADGKTIFDGKISRSFETILQTVRDREDPTTAAAAIIQVSW
jgi:hypothetical protein